jgi:hypothetical protein
VSSLKIRKTLYSWLTQRYTFIIRSEENFAEKRSLSFNYAKLLVIVVSYSVILLIFSYYLITTVLSAWLDPRQKALETQKKIVSLSVKVDSLASEMDKRERYIQDLKKVLSE